MVRNIIVKFHCIWITRTKVVVYTLKLTDDDDDDNDNDNDDDSIIPLYVRKFFAVV